MSGIRCRRGRLKISCSNAVSKSAARQFLSGGTASGRCLRPGVAAGQTTGRRTRIARFDGDKEPWRGSGISRLYGNSPRCTPRSTTTSIQKAISSAGICSRPAALPLWPNGGNPPANSRSAPVNPHPRQLLGQCPWARCLCRLETRCRRTVTLYGRWSSAWRVATSECAPRCRNSTAHCKRKAANARGGALHGNARIRRSAP